ncbi:AAA family ATPase [Qipengyuania gaetbuli]|uniref:AAA family ATPase n=1 Tax=Qipengyuania gaetbuli TaxID=266952 RepID=UPI001C99DD49|nr:AAA family ATPase [Qipengyuania gaetbuli]MBY6014698.1 AAA family ATPase [Qipengyuania gaetbuli]
MTEDKFKEWLASEGLVASSISTRISDLRRVEKHFGDLDAAYDQDGCASIFQKLTYTADDQAAGKPNPSGIEIEGNLYDGLSGYKSSLTAYVRFRNSETNAGVMSEADRIRQHVADNHANPARRRGERQFSVVSGDIHRDLGLANAMPAVCSALDSRKFAELIDGELVDRVGPANSSTVRFTFSLNAEEAFDIAAAERELKRRYGEEIPTIKDTGNQYITSFALPDERQVALEKEGQSVRIWIEGSRDNPPPAGSPTYYAPDQGRQANLPRRLKHLPPGGAQPREVIKITLADRASFNDVLDWYEAQGSSAGPLTRAAVLAAIRECEEIGTDPFLDKHGFMRPRTYWIAENGKFYPCKAIANVALRAVEGSDAQIRDATRSRELISRLGFRVVDRLDERFDTAELERLKQRFLSFFPDFEPAGFAPSEGGYYDEERGYKEALLEKAQAALDDSSLSQEELGGRFLDILTGPQSGLLGWRTDARIKALRASYPGMLEAEAGSLILSNDDPAVALGRFVDATWPILSEGQDKSQPYSESRNIPSMLLALAHPTEAIGINTDPLWRASKALTGKPPFGNNTLNENEYAEVLDLAEALFEKFEEWGWQPRDLWDVQGFIWVVREAQDTAQPDNDSDHDETKPMPRPTNLILYGPPGTGKTYRTAKEAVQLCDGSAPDDRSELKARYDTLVEAGQIGFVTFHQSYAYEDFVEGLRPETGSEGGEEAATGAGFRLEARHGIFREICAIAQDARKNVGRRGGYNLEGRKFFKMSLGRSGSEDYIYDAAIEGGYVVLGWGGEVDWSDQRFADWQSIADRWREDYPEATGYDANVVQTATLRVTMKPGDLIIVSAGNRHFRAIGEVIGPYEFIPTEVRDYNHRRAVRWLLVPEEPLPVEMIYGRNFMMQSCYQLDSKKVKLEALARLLPGDAPNVGASPDQFVLIIDEINRANISKVFGELITLIEEDKRLGGANQTTVKLPYSGDVFGVPDNLHIIGTMNTADRSIALLDTALRRRFTFRELMPEPDLLQEAAERTGVPLVGLLRRLNERIEYLFDREHQIGHAYFMNCQTIEDVHETMRHRVIPLLAEYFYEDWNKVALVLGDAEGAGRFLTRTQLAPPAGIQSDGYSEERWRWQVRDHFDDSAYDAFA